MSQAEKEVNQELDVKHTNARLSLRERQLQELADAMNIYNPEDSLRKEYEDQAKMAAEEAKKFREETMSKIQEELAKAKEERRHKDDDRRRKLETQFK